LVTEQILHALTLLVRKELKLLTVWRKFCLKKIIETQTFIWTLECFENGEELNLQNVMQLKKVSSL